LIAGFWIWQSGIDGSRLGETAPTSENPKLKSVLFLQEMILVKNLPGTERKRAFKQRLSYSVREIRKAIAY